MFSCWIVTNITSARGTLHYRKTRIPCGDQLVTCGLYRFSSRTAGLYANIHKCSDAVAYAIDIVYIKSTA
jgi:hypothetical protein